MKVFGGRMEKFIIGVAVGGLCGALLVANNYKMRALVKKGQEEVQKKLDELLDEKLDEMEQQAENVVKDVKKAGKKATKKLKEKLEKATDN